MIAADRAKSVVEGKGLLLPTLVLNRFPQWLQAGAVGPDYPYLHHALTSHDESDSWADLLHYVRTGDVVRAGVDILRQRYPTEKDSQAFLRALAWLYGYASHVVLDASIHPVVRAIVGEYEDNKTDHRVCEMYMDSYIFNETYGYELSNSEWADYLRSLTDPITGGMDTSVVSLWDKILQQTHPDDYSRNPPQIHEWHKAYVSKLDSADLNIGFFRHIAGSNGLLYVPSTDIPPERKTLYIDQAAIPSHNRFGRSTMSYTDVFEFGVGNVAYFWELMTKAIEGTGDPLLANLLNWNLDKGTIDPGGAGDATLWV
jgi:hypothetical protein